MENRDIFKVTWVKDTRRFASGSNAMVGKWTIGSAYYNSTGPRGDLNKYTGACFLPGYASKKNFTSIEAAMRYVEGAIWHWFSGESDMAEDRGCICKGNWRQRLGVLS